MKLSTMMPINLPELSCKFWESLSKQPTEPEPQFAAAGLQETKVSSALTKLRVKDRGPCQGGTCKPRPFDSRKQPTSCSAGSPEKNASQTWINKLLQSENQTHFSPSVPPLSAKSGKVKWRQPFMVLRGEMLFSEPKTSREEKPSKFGPWKSQDTIRGQSQSSSYPNDGENSIPLCLNLGWTKYVTMYECMPERQVVIEWLKTHCWKINKCQVPFRGIKGQLLLILKKTTE